MPPRKERLSYQLNARFSSSVRNTCPPTPAHGRNTNGAPLLPAVRYVTAQRPHFGADVVTVDITAFNTHLFFYGCVFRLKHLDIPGGRCNNRNFTELHWFVPFGEGRINR
jgi:hypothetical protein